MRILFVVPYTPNLIRVRPYNLIRFLAERGHEVTLATLTAGEGEEANVRALQPYCERVISRPLPRWRSLWNCLLTLPTRAPLQSAYCWQPALARDLEKLIAGSGEAPFDVAHVEHLRGARYGLHLLQHANRRPPIVWDSVDSISYLFRQAAVRSRSRSGRWMTRMELTRTERYESWLLRQFRHVLVTSPTDKQAFLALAADDRRASIHLLPNGVDLDYFRPAHDVKRDEKTIVVTGKMSYHANVTMVLFLVREILPLVWAQRPGVNLTVVGKDPPKELLDLQQLPGVTVTGTVPDIRPYLRQATVAASPIQYGAGIQNKVLEAMACKTPVVATSPAVSALTAKPGQDLLVADGAQPFARAILTLLEDEVRREAIGAAGYQYVTSRHDWKKITGRLEGIYRSAISASTTG